VLRKCRTGLVLVVVALVPENRRKDEDEHEDDDEQEGFTWFSRHALTSDGLNPWQYRSHNRGQARCRGAARPTRGRSFPPGLAWSLIREVQCEPARDSLPARDISRPYAHLVFAGVERPRETRGDALIFPAVYLGHKRLKARRLGIQMNPKAARRLPRLQYIVRLVESPLEISQLGHPVPEQQAGRRLGIGPHIVAGPGPFVRPLAERQRGFLLEEVAAWNHPQFEIPIQGLGPSQAVPGELFVPGPLDGDDPHELDRFSPQGRQLALAQFPYRERNSSF